MAALTQSQLETEIHDCGLYKAKAKNLLGMCHMLLSDYHGEVPEDFDDLVKLPGVGRKTANVVRSVAFGYPAIAVDTHVFRVSNRLKLAEGTTPLEVEKVSRRLSRKGLVFRPSLAYLAWKTGVPRQETGLRDLLPAERVPFLHSEGNALEAGVIGHVDTPSA